MENIDISEITINQLNLSKIDEQGNLWRRCYINTPTGRQELLADFGEAVFIEVCKTWGEQATVVEPIIEQESEQPQEPTEFDYLIDLDYRISLLELGI
ncbi:MAG: hypothetical protein K0R07_166 [Sedimentibacter sp.]|jgi:hypothetical protein|nr:hypothetical protein [Sedimentibacter sp.]